MAQTKRRRRTKHRGNAAGVVELRGRTGRPPTAEERKASQRTSAREKRAARYDQPPTWKGAFNRGLIAAALMILVSLLLLKKPTSAIVLFPIVLLIYVPFGFYTDKYFYRRRQRQKAAGRAP